MKLIDLLCLMAKGETIPNYIKTFDKIFKLYIEEGNYYYVCHEKLKNGIVDNYLLQEFINFGNLNEEIQVLGTQDLPVEERVSILEDKIFGNN